MYIFVRAFAASIFLRRGWVQEVPQGGNHLKHFLHFTSLINVTFILTAFSIVLIVVPAIDIVI